MSLKPCSLAVFSLVLFLSSITTDGSEKKADDPRRKSVRYTPTVRLIEKCLPSVVVIHNRGGQGSGTILHPAGYILTNNHVVENAVRGIVVLHDGQESPYRTIASLPQEDIALLKIDAAHSLKPLPLGRSHDLMLGEPTLAIGHPVGLQYTVSTGIVSGLARRSAFSVPQQIQTTAAAGHGSSGGPLINALGEQIGIIWSGREEAENIAFAVSIDRVRQSFPQMLVAEDRYGFHLGINVNMLGPQAEVTSVAAGSPGARAGVRPGDLIRRANDMVVRQGVDFQLALIDQNPGQPVKLEIQRGDETTFVNPVLAPFKAIKTVTDDGLVNGLHYAAYDGEWVELPDFDELEPVMTGRADRPTVEAYNAEGDRFALKFTGFIRIPSDGLYTFYLSSDDGSRLDIGDRLVVDNDGPHDIREAAGDIRLKSGLNPITIIYFELTGQAVLKVALEGPGLEKQELDPRSLFIREKDLQKHQD
ncbi:MAG: trypsin-like peptidase domain-containing protein [Paracoccaceae bacterium]